jgi:hypothetical protein
MSAAREQRVPCWPPPSCSQVRKQELPRGEVALAHGRPGALKESRWLIVKEHFAPSVDR